MCGWWSCEVSERKGVGRPASRSTHSSNTSTSSCSRVSSERSSTNDWNICVSSSSDTQPLLLSSLRSIQPILSNLSTTSTLLLPVCSVVRKSRYVASRRAKKRMNAPLTSSSLTGTPGRSGLAVSPNSRLSALASGAARAVGSCGGRSSALPFHCTVLASRSTSSTPSSSSASGRYAAGQPIMKGMGAQVNSSSCCGSTGM